MQIFPKAGQVHGNSQLADQEYGQYEGIAQ